VAKASDEDIEGLYGKGAEDKFVDDCFAHGCDIIFITRGADGASGITRKSSFNETAKAVEVKDTVGAGDTFQATLLHWMAAHNHIDKSGGLTGDVDVQSCLQFALTAAAVTCGRLGADLPTLEDVEGSLN